MKYNLTGVLFTIGILITACNPEKQSDMPKQFTGPSDREYRVIRIEDSLELDGTGSDSLWESAIRLDSFIFPWQDRPVPPTHFYALHNQTHFYFKFEVEDADIILAENEIQNLAVIGSDRVELFFAANDSLNPYYQLEMDPRTWVFSAKSHLYREVDDSWDWEGLKTFASISEKGYILEGRIPMESFSTLALWQDLEKSRLLCGVFRAEFEQGDEEEVKHNWISWIQPDSPTPDFHIPSAFGILIFD